MDKGKLILLTIHKQMMKMNLNMKGNTIQSMSMQLSLMILILSWSHSWHAHHAAHARHAHAHVHLLLHFPKPGTAPLRIKLLTICPVGLSIHVYNSIFVQHPARHQQ